MNLEFWFCLGSAGIGLAISMVAIALSQLHDDLAKVLQRWAALDNLGLFPATDELKEVGFAPGDDWVLDENQQWRRLDEVQRG